MSDILKLKVYEVNTPYIVHETIEGETIAMNLRDGNYYSFDGIGPAIWELITKKISVEHILDILSLVTQLSSGQISEMVHEFVAELATNDLIRTPASLDEYAGIDLDERNQFIELHAGTPARKPVFHRYSDMRDILLLDPIHDVDAVGWPEPKQR